MRKNPYIDKKIGARKLRFCVFKWQTRVIAQSEKDCTTKFSQLFSPSLPLPFKIILKNFPILRGFPCFFYALMI